MIPTKKQNPEGLHGKYKIQKADGKRAQMDMFMDTETEESVSESV